MPKSPDNAQNVLRVTAEGQDYQYAAVPGLKSALTNAVKNLLPGDPTSYDIELAAFVLTSGDTYLVPITPTTGEGNKPPGASQISGGITIERWSVNPKYCSVNIGGWTFYYQC